MYGPVTLRRNDLLLLSRSNLNNRLATIQEDDEDQFIIFDDSAYLFQSHIRSYHLNIENDIEFRRWNYAMKKVRISIEWNYGYTTS